MSKPKFGLGDLKQLQKRAAKVADQAARRAAAQTKAAAEPGRADALSADDKRLFRQAVKHVRRIKDTRRAVLQPVPTAPDAILAERRARAVGQEPARPAPVSDHFVAAGVPPEAGEFLQAGQGPDVIKQLRRGKWPIGAALDLHGDTLDDARERLDRFIASCVQHQVRCVQVIHGKGHGSKDGHSVLKETVRRWLGQMHAVLAYVECAERDGGAGAVQVLLRVGETEADTARAS